jgi:hypothetical protein
MVIVFDSGICRFGSVLRDDRETLEPIVTP